MANKHFVKLYLKNNIVFLDSQLRYGLKGASFLSLEESNYVAEDGASEPDLSLRLNPAAGYSKGTHSVIVQVSDGIFQKEQSVLVYIDESCQENFRFKQKVRQIDELFLYYMNL